MAAAATLAPALGGMLALASALGIGRFVYTPILPAMAEALGLSKTAAGLIASANFLGYLAGALAAALPRLPGGRRARFLGALACGAVATAAVGWADTLPAFLLLRLVGGAASAFVLVFGSVLVLDRLARAGLDRWAALHFAGVGLGIALSALLVDALQGAGAGWRALWLAAGAAATVAVPLAAWLVPAGEEATAGAPPPGNEDNRTSLPRGLGLLTLCHGLFGFGYVVTATFIVAAVRASPGLRALEGAVWLVVGLAAMPSTAGWGWAGRRLGVLPAYALACLAAAAGVAAGGLWQSPAGALLAAALLGGTFMGITALGFAAARALAPKQARNSSALMTAGFGLGQVAGPLAAGRLLDATGGSFAVPSLVAAAALALAAVVAGTATGRHPDPGLWRPVTRSSKEPRP
ncbi:MAG TPA: YbfB/YjiJ family MFS transporter [Acetobacteraceae bacterium]|nr:YbfB/YjiJ family MFS transporter [Acetobacteraceae bacterium]